MVRFDSGGSVTWDLGRARSISAVVGQADANDTYVISASPDGKPGSYVNIAQLANVVDAGPGMRTRSVQIAPTTARFIRIGNGDGDGAYSIAELAVYCKAPQPFPPAFARVEAPMAAVPAPPNEHYVTAVDGGDRPTTPAFEIGLAILALLLVAAMIVAATRGQAATRELVSARERYLPAGAAAVHRQRLRRADLRSHLAAAVAAGARVVGGVDRRPLGDVHGGHVHRQPGAVALCLTQASPAARLRGDRAGCRRVRAAGAGRDAAGPARLRRGRGPRRQRLGGARPLRGRLPAAADDLDGGHPARHRALGRDHAARGLVAGILLRRQHRRCRRRVPAGRLLLAARDGHADRHVRRRRPERGGDRRRVGVVDGHARGPRARASAARRRRTWARPYTAAARPVPPT